MNKNLMQNNSVKKILYFIAIISLTWLSFFHGGIVEKMVNYDVERSGNILGKILSYVFIIMFILAYFKKLKSKKQAFLIMLICLNFGYILAISKVVKL